MCITRRAPRFPACALTPRPRPSNKVVLVFASLTWLLVGSSSEDFSQPGWAWLSVIRVSLGNESFYPQILAAQPAGGPVIVVVYQVLAVVLLLNVVIAVLLEVWYTCFCCCCY